MGSSGVIVGLRSDWCAVALTEKGASGRCPIRFDHKMIIES